MIYLTNFFARKIEAVSKQVEDSRSNKKDPIITCCYFLNQKPLRLMDIKDNIWIFPKRLYPIAAFLLLVFSKMDVHIFEDEPSTWRRISLNIRKRKLFISLFKDVNLSLISHINSINNVRCVIVEDERSMKFVKKNLSDKKIPVVLIYPPSLWKVQKTGCQKRINLLFASWNGGDKNTLIERGIYDLLYLVKRTPANCTIILRDNQTRDLYILLDQLGIRKKVRVVFPKNTAQLKNEFRKSHYVVLIPRKPVMKYVPNSIIDGLSLGKPCIISGSLRFAETVKKEKLGRFFDHKDINNFTFPSTNIYNKMSQKCLFWANNNISYPYSKSLSEVYRTN